MTLQYKSFSEKCLRNRFQQWEYESLSLKALWTRVFLSSCKIKVQPQNKSWQLVDSSSSRDTTSTSQAAFVFNCSSTKTNNRHVFALRNVSLRECISIIHVSECVCVCVCLSKGRKKEGLSVPFNSFPLMASKHLQTIRQLLRGRCISADEKRCAFPVEMQRTADTQQYSCSRVLAQKHKRRTVL